MKRNTSFGSLETLVEKNGHLVAELATFNKNGRPHTHDETEVCYVTSGTGSIIQILPNGERKVSEVKAGDVVNIPPNTSHWMEVKAEELEILIVYTSAGQV